MILNDWLTKCLTFNDKPIEGLDKVMMSTKIVLLMDSKPIIMYNKLLDKTTIIKSTY